MQAVREHSPGEAVAFQVSREPSSSQIQQPQGQGGDDTLLEETHNRVGFQARATLLPESRVVRAMHSLLGQRLV